MATAINKTDLLYVTALSSGVTLLSTSLCGAASIGDVFRHVKAQTDDAKGVVTLRIRNSTQGWTQHHNIVLKHRPIGSAIIPTSTKQDSYPSLFD
ncbi:MAG: hypothetical protein K2G17_09515 [Duncaniella sp.]|nr:hypothetical protein [Duncaniella sp.]MDE6188348.1 hypothetical protein [Duncaniella sp.]